MEKGFQKDMQQVAQDIHKLKSKLGNMHNKYHNLSTRDVRDRDAKDRDSSVELFEDKNPFIKPKKEKIDDDSNNTHLQDKNKTNKTNDKTKK